MAFVTGRSTIRMIYMMVSYVDVAIDSIMGCGGGVGWGVGFIGTGFEL
jgi:hypothetical protein